MVVGLGFTRIQNSTYLVTCWSSDTLDDSCSRLPLKSMLRKRGLQTQQSSFRAIVAVVDPSTIDHVTSK